MCCWPPTRTCSIAGKPVRSWRPRLMLERAAGRPDEAGEAAFAAADGAAPWPTSPPKPAFKALLLALPSEQDLSLESVPADPAAIHEARESLRARMAKDLRDTLNALHADLGRMARAFGPTPAGAGAPRPVQRRALSAGLKAGREHRRARRPALLRLHQHDRRHGWIERPDAAGRRSRSTGPWNISTSAGRASLWWSTSGSRSRPPIPRLTPWSGCVG